MQHETFSGLTVQSCCQLWLKIEPPKVLFWGWAMPGIVATDLKLLWESVPLSGLSRASDWDFAASPANSLVSSAWPTRGLPRPSRLSPFGTHPLFRLVIAADSGLRAGVKGATLACRRCWSNSTAMSASATLTSFGRKCSSRPKTCGNSTKAPHSSSTSR